MSVAILIAARTASSRVPRKVLAEIAGVPLIVRLIRRVRRSREATSVVLCTSRHPDDRGLVEIAVAEDVPCVVGSERNVLQRFDAALTREQAEIAVRVTGDNPLTDPGVIDELVRRHRESGADYTYTTDTPRGVRPEVISAATVRAVLRRAEDPESSEYMTNMLRRPDLFRVVEHGMPHPGWVRPAYRLTVDTPEDLRLVRAVYAHFDGRDDMPLDEITGLLDGRPDLVALNAGIRPKAPESWVNVAIRPDTASR